MSDSKFRILIAMSGGVDSSVAAALLVESGHEVIGVMMHLWSDPSSENNCCTLDSMTAARQVAHQIGIPFHTIDVASSFRSQVVQYFIDTYKQGETPNPCVHCNRYFRWNTLRRKAQELGASHIATGHYARLLEDNNGEFQLFRGVDSQKDQSYVLHGLSQKHLASTLFPVGEYTKTEIRQFAHRNNLSVADTPDSQDLCFVGEDGYRDFLIRHTPEVLNPGPIKTRNGEVVAQHQGLAFYTIGQRKGLRISSDKPYYVLSKDINSNTLVVGHSNDIDCLELVAGNVNWISNTSPLDPFFANVKIRYKSRAHPARVTPLSTNRVQVNFEYPVRDITPGQFAVFYQDDVCLGGGAILPN